MSAADDASPHQGTKRSNEAVTQGGARYNKLQRPNDYNPNAKAPSLARERTSDFEDGEPGNAETVAATDAQIYTNYRKPSKRKQKDVQVKEDFGGQTSIGGAPDDAPSEDVDDAMAYLNSVRNEALTLPTITNAAVIKKKEADEEKHNDSPHEEAKETEREAPEYGTFHGFYQDGIYRAAPKLGPRPPSSAASTAAFSSSLSNRAQSAFRKTLLNRYKTLNRRLHKPPPPHTLTTLKQHQHLACPAGPRPIKHWRRSLTHHSPVPSQVASLDKHSVLRILHLVTYGNLVRGTNIPKQLSAWTFALLARAPLDRSIEEVAAVRELARRAVWVKMSFAVDEEEGLALAKRTEGDEIGRRLESAYKGHIYAAVDISGQARGMDRREEDTRYGGDEEDGELAEGDGKLNEDMDPDFPDLNTRATCDMIITIAGEIWGQRDLLSQREVWIGGQVLDLF
ncbi:hypothetical protein K402DRAFT_456297 [Aulographum hederae CBS 113979]|uniref:Uncharacterized protein n=1 Tax=Aulographum hederae CBS 113979 TaxID=1176131 RepID=A0A6G1GSA0_9PEZI|nr:hypothetical protein K402DRAFT_456297 [Aulographum hederae CBS 113979]